MFQQAGKNKKVLFRIAICFVFAAFLLQPVAALAEIKLENFYPNIPGVKAITGQEARLGDIVKYYSQWALIIAILVCVISIIWAGASYVASSGQPNVMRQARERITNSFIGLAILVSSYLILNTLNPQFVLTKVLNTSIPKTGIVLLTKAGYDALNTGQEVNDLVAAGSARWLNYDIAISEKEFGPLVNYNNSAVDQNGNPVLCGPQGFPCDFNFLRFPIYGLGFLPGSEEDYKVAIFSNTNFLDTKLVYKADGQWDEKNDKLIAASTPLSSGIKIISIDKVLKKSPVRYWGNAKDSAPVSDEELAKITSQQETDPKIKLFTRDGDFSFVPPLSIKLFSEAPGVYLYSDNDPSKGEMRYFSSSVERLGRDDVKFDDKAMSIRIKNTSPSNTGGVQHQFLAILYSLSDFTGQARIFFSASDKDKINLSDTGSGLDLGWDSIPYLYSSKDYKSGKIDLYTIIQDAEKNGVNFSQSDSPANRIFSEMRPAPPSDKPFISAKFKTFMRGNGLGNTVQAYQKAKQELILSFGQKDIGDKAISIYSEDNALSDMYGSISSDDKVSSIQVFELNENPTACESVKFCRKIGGCFEFRPVSSAVLEPKRSDSPVILPMPYYITVNMPNIAYPYIYTDETGDRPMTSQKLDFDDAIDTITMSGKCLVVLFENKVSFFSGEGNLLFLGWQNGTGQRTTTLDYTQGNLIDLAIKPIHQCRNAGHNLGLTAGAPCLSAVAVFSIK